jgi:hypothetical protein
MSAVLLFLMMVGILVSGAALIAVAILSILVLRDWFKPLPGHRAAPKD